MEKFNGVKETENGDKYKRRPVFYYTLKLEVCVDLSPMCYAWPKRTYNSFTRNQHWGGDEFQDFSERNIVEHILKELGFVAIENKHVLFV